VPSKLWTGSISFGLVNIPVSLVRAEQRNERLVAEMTEDWDPKKHHDEYRDELLAFIRKRGRAGQLAVASETREEPTTPKRADIIDIAELLKRSLAKTGEDRRRPRRRKSA
jgi:non-homologous end joining protein Ku